MRLLVCEHPECMHMQIIAVGMTNRRDCAIYSFPVPLWTALTHYVRFRADDNDDDDKTDYFTPLRMCTG